MCGRYTETKAEALLKARFGFGNDLPVEPRYNVAPTQDAPVVVESRETKRRELRLMRWGLVPYWAKDVAAGVKAINARSETLEGKRTFEPSFRKRRCLVLADGFYEWRKQGGKRQPIRFVLKGAEPFAFAGLWDRWKAPNGQPLESFTIVTGPPNELVAPVHDRMPVILLPQHEALWLDREVTDLAVLKPLLVPYPAGAMEAHEVSSLVNNARVDEPACIEPGDGGVRQLSLLPC